MEMCDIDNIIKTLTIIVDTREQMTDKSFKRLETMNLPYQKKKLDFGDYSAKCTMIDGTEFSLENSVVIERKMNLDELCNCYCTDRARFTREFERAKNSSAKIILLVENADFEKVFAGKYRSRMHPNSLIASITTWLARYNCQLLFCKEETSGKLIAECFKREMLEALIRKVDESA